MQRTALFVLLAGFHGSLAATFVTAPDQSLKVQDRYIFKMSDTMQIAGSSFRLESLVAKYDEATWPASGETMQKVFSMFNAAEVTITTPQNLASLLAEADVTLVEEVQVVSAVGPMSRERRQTAVGSWGIDRVNQLNLPLDNTALTEADIRNSNNVDVFVLDTGVDTTHAEFEGRAINSWSAYNTNVDGQGHGTHVAGTITSKTYGLSRARVRSVKVLGQDGMGSTATVMAGLNYVAANFDRTRASVASLSLGGGFSQASNDAVEYLISVGVTVVVAAGNNNQNACSYSPSSATNAITVGSTTVTDDKSNFSNWGPCVDIFAPGSSITSVVPSSRTSIMSGTSMSAPHVAAAAAIYLSNNRLATPSQVARALLDSASANVIKGLRTDTPNRLLYIRPTTPTPTLVTTTTTAPYPSYVPYPIPTTTYYTTTTTTYQTVPGYTPVPTRRKTTRCECITRNQNIVSTTWCRRYNGCTYFPTYCNCMV